MRSLLAFLIPLLVGCSSSSVPATASISITGKTDMPSYRYLALGDSYTIGESVAAKDRWPNQLARSLADEGIQAEVTMIARTGWTVKELWNGIEAEPPTGTYDLVTLLIGVNDQYRGYPVEGYQEDFRFLLGKAVEFAGGDPAKVIVLSIPDWSNTPFAAARASEPISQKIDEFNEVNFEATRSAGAQYVDVTSLSRMAMDDFALVTGDGLHPSAQMYALWTEKVLPVALEVLR
jgi:lysophospholipase L1-like esterase